MSQEAITERRKIIIKGLHKKDQAGNTNNTENEPAEAVAHEEFTPGGLVGKTILLTLFGYLVAAGALPSQLLEIGGWACAFLVQMCLLLRKTNNERFSSHHRHPFPLIQFRRSQKLSGPDQIPFDFQRHKVSWELISVLAASRRNMLVNR